MKIFKTTSILFLFLFLNVSCSNQKNDITDVALKNNIDRYLKDAIQLHNIPGLALAVIDNNKIVYENYFGKASLEDNKPVDKNTLFRVFSATKLITSTGVFQLVQEGKIELNDAISKHISNLPLEWQKIKIKNLLSHSSGLPDIIRYRSTLSDEELMDKLSKDKMDFVTGSQFRYNQTNYWLLAQIIEKVTRMTFNDFILKNQFDDSTNGILFSSNSQEIIPNRASRYFYNRKAKKFEKDTNNSGKRGYSGNGLNITLDKFIEWNNLLDNNKLLDEQTKSKMWTPFNFTNQRDNFLYGWGNYPVSNLSSYGFSGGNLAAFRKFVNNKITIVLLSNGYEIPAYDIIINDIAKIAIPELRTKRLTLEEDVMNLVVNNHFSKATLSFKKLKEENPNSDFENLKWNINSIGNVLTKENKIQEAFQVFKFNAEANPNWWVSIAGLAETYEMQGDTLNAIANYQKAVLFNENNEWNYNDQMNKKITELKK